MKLESINSKGVYLAPKVYALRNIEGREEIKFKGLSHEAIIQNNITLNTLESLLEKDSLFEAKQKVWIRAIERNTINIVDQIYSLKVTSNKAPGAQSEARAEN